MSDWNDFVRRFYALSPEEQQTQWESLTPDQKAQFEAATTSASAKSNQPLSTKKWTFPKIAILGCAGVVALSLIAFLGLAIIGGLSKQPEATEKVYPRSPPTGAEPSTQQPVEPEEQGPVTSTEWQQIASWSGNGIKQTESFSTVNREWRVQWQTSNEPFASAGIFQIMVYRADNDSLVTLAANKQGVGRDVSYVRGPPGRYYLMINSGNVDWNVQVEDQR